MRFKASDRRLFAQAAALALTFGTAALTPGGVAVSWAQTAPADARPAHVRMNTFYRAPDLAAVPSLLAALEPSGSDRNRAPGIIGFLAGLFTKYPDRIDAMLTPPPGDSLRRHVIFALFMAGQDEAAHRHAKAWGIDPAPVSKGPRLQGHKPVMASDLDVLWAASFATGDPAYPKAIFDFYAAFANRGEVDGADIDTAANFRKLGDPTPLKAIAQKYGAERTRELVHVASALWSLRSNSAQHPFVAAAIAEKLATEGDSPAARTYRLSNP